MKSTRNDGKKTNVEGKKKFYACLSGIAAGIANGLFGGGGGMIIVPMLILLLGVPVKKSHATAILMILPMSIISGLFYASQGNVQLSVTVPIGIGVALGGIAGALLLPKLSSKIVVIIFSVIITIAGVKMLFF